MLPPTAVAVVFTLLFCDINQTNVSFVINGNLRGIRMISGNRCNSRKAKRLDNRHWLPSCLAWQSWAGDMNCTLKAAIAVPGQPASQSLRLQPETRIKRQTTRHGCLPGFLGDGDKGEEKYFVLGRLEHHEEPNETTKEGPISYVLPESPFASVSNSQQGATPLFSLSDCKV